MCCYVTIWHEKGKWGYNNSIYTTYFILLYSTIIIWVTSFEKNSFLNLVKRIYNYFYFHLCAWVCCVLNLYHKEVNSILQNMYIQWYEHKSTILAFFTSNIYIKFFIYLYENHTSLKTIKALNHCMHFYKRHMRLNA